MAPYVRGLIEPTDSEVFIIFVKLGAVISLNIVFCLLPSFENSNYIYVCNYTLHIYM